MAHHDAGRRGIEQRVEPGTLRFGLGHRQHARRDVDAAGHRAGDGTAGVAQRRELEVDHHAPVVGHADGFIAAHGLAPQRAAHVEPHTFDDRGVVGPPGAVLEAPAEHVVTGQPRGLQGRRVDLDHAALGVEQADEDEEVVDDAAQPVFAHRHGRTLLLGRPPRQLVLPVRVSGPLASARRA